MTFNLVWTATTGGGATGSNTILAAPGDLLTLSIRMTNTVALGAHSISLDFDTDLANELTLTPDPNGPSGAWNWDGYPQPPSPTPFCYAATSDPFILESTSSQAGHAWSYSSFGESECSLPPGTYTIGFAKFVASNPRIDGADIIGGFFNTGSDGLSDSSFNEISGTAVFGTATVNAAPHAPAVGAWQRVALVVLLLSLLAVEISRRRSTKAARQDWRSG